MYLFIRIPHSHRPPPSLAWEKWRNIGIKRKGRRRLGHCNCVYDLANGRKHCTCSFHKHFEIRMTNLKKSMEVAHSSLKEEDPLKQYRQSPRSTVSSSRRTQRPSHPTPGSSNPPRRRSGAPLSSSTSSIARKPKPTHSHTARPPRYGGPSPSRTPFSFDDDEASMFLDTETPGHSLELHHLSLPPSPSRKGDVKQDRVLGDTEDVVRLRNIHSPQRRKAASSASSPVRHSISAW